jgi:glycosyltransferase involved in cell wall biosynthesis
MTNRVSVILFENPDQRHFSGTLDSLCLQSFTDFNIVGIIEKQHITCDEFSHKIPFFFVSKSNFPESLNNALACSDSEFVLLIDNRDINIILRNAALDAFVIAAERNPSGGMFYADYELKTGSKIKEVRLLHHHIGRVRDNQDLGKVLFFRREAIEVAGAFDESVSFNCLYDLRLKISEKFNIIRIANKNSGSSYTVLASEKNINVFDYLLSGREIQIEAERVFTSHLQRVNAYLSPGDLAPRDCTYDDSSELTASIIIPVHHRPEFICHAIESVQAQTYRNIETIVVVNGGEDDPTAKEVMKYMEGGQFYDPEKPSVRLRVIDINNIGLCINIGVNMAKGKYYIQLDSDDRLKPDAVEKILAVFDASSDIGMVIGSYEVWEKMENGELRRDEKIPVVTHDEWTDENGRNNLLRINGAGAPRAIPISVIRQMGYFSVNDDQFARNYGEDYEMVLKISEHFRIGRVWEPIYEVVRHAGGTDHSINDEVIARNDEAKDEMRKQAIMRRIAFNRMVKRNTGLIG